jgi:hypothetical protein
MRLGDNSSTTPTQQLRTFSRDCGIRVRDVGLQPGESTRNVRFGLLNMNVTHADEVGRRQNS